MGELNEVISSFDKEMKVTQHLCIHTRASTEKDQKGIIQQLAEADIFAYVSNRKRSQIKKDYSSLSRVPSRNFSLGGKKLSCTHERNKYCTCILKVVCAYLINTFAHFEYFFI